MMYVNCVDYILIDMVGRNYLVEELVSEIFVYIDVVYLDLMCFIFFFGMKSVDVMMILLKLVEILIDGFIIIKMDEMMCIGDLYMVM